MAPIYDTDIAKQRWDRADWENYELWEKVEHRHRRHRRMWIAATAAVFVALSSIPIVLDRWDKWATLAASRRLAQELNRVKRDAGVEHVAYRIRFRDGLTFVVEKSARCTDPQGSVVREGQLFHGSAAQQYVLLNADQGVAIGVPGLVQELCYDYLSGNAVAVGKADAVSGFGIISAKDLAEQRQDRLSVLSISGPSADPAFD